MGLVVTAAAVRAMVYHNTDQSLRMELLREGWETMGALIPDIYVATTSQGTFGRT